MIAGRAMTSWPTPNCSHNCWIRGGGSVAQGLPRLAISALRLPLASTVRGLPTGVAAVEAGAATPFPRVVVIRHLANALGALTPPEGFYPAVHLAHDQLLCVLRVLADPGHGAREVLGGRSRRGVGPQHRGDEFDERERAATPVRFVSDPFQVRALVLDPLDQTFVVALPPRRGGSVEVANGDVGRGVVLDRAPAGRTAVLGDHAASPGRPASSMGTTRSVSRCSLCSLVCLCGPNACANAPTTAGISRLSARASATTVTVTTASTRIASGHS